jgi:hypothetical protein
MKKKDHLGKNTKTKTNHKSKERLSERDIIELMGMKRDTYKRGRGGAIRRK